MHKKQFYSFILAKFVPLPGGSGKSGGVLCVSCFFTVRYNNLQIWIESFLSVSGVFFSAIFACFLAILGEFLAKSADF